MVLTSIFLAMCLLILFSSFITLEAIAAIYYISPTGSDGTGAGTKASPWVTLAKANTVMKAGDTVYCRGGTYSGQNVIWTAQGTAGNPITIAAYPGETPEFVKGTGNSTFFFVREGSPDVGALTFDGLSMRYYNIGLLLRRGGDFIIKNCTFRDITANTAGAIHTGYTGCAIRDLTIENCYFENIGRLTEIARDHSFYPSGSGTHGNIIVRNNYFKDSHGGPALNMIPGTSCNIYNNIFYSTVGVGRQSVYITGSPTGGAFNIYNNTFVINPDGAGTNSWAIKTTYWGGTQDDITIKNNIFYYTATNTDPIVTKIGKPNPTMDNNIYFNCSDSNDTGANSFVGNPLFNSIGKQDFYLQSSSPAIDAGTATLFATKDYKGYSRSYGRGPDIGACEFTVQLTAPRGFSLQGFSIISASN
ncbi:MAG: hypothetical protein MRK02_09260 [Candidatus Scalindua sp.]|nr:hypothetical protein [Candidatus Scalindua sp.]